MRRARPIAGLGLVVCALAVSALAQEAERRSAEERPDPGAESRGVLRRARGPGTSPAITGAQSEAGRALSEGRPMDLGTATAAELELLPRVGPALARRIVAHREARGGLGEVDDLLDVRGIGPATLERIRPFLTAGSPGPQNTAPDAGPGGEAPES